MPERSPSNVNAFHTLAGGANGDPLIADALELWSAGIGSHHHLFSNWNTQQPYK